MAFLIGRLTLRTATTVSTLELLSELNLIKRVLKFFFVVAVLAIAHEFSLGSVMLVGLRRHLSFLSRSLYLDLGLGYDLFGYSRTALYHF